MSTDNVLSVGEAIALGDLLAAIGTKRAVRWLAAGDDTTIHSGELRSLVVGPNNFAFAPWGTDVRDMFVWVTGAVGESTFSVRHGVDMLQNGGMAFDD